MQMAAQRRLRLSDHRCGGKLRMPSGPVTVPIGRCPFSGRAAGASPQSYDPVTQDPDSGMSSQTGEPKLALYPICPPGQSP